MKDGGTALVIPCDHYLVSARLTVTSAFPHDVITHGRVHRVVVNSVKANYVKRQRRVTLPVKFRVLLRARLQIRNYKSA